jgi:hypothetical protein
MNLSFRFLATLCVLIFFPFAKLARAGDLTSAVVPTLMPLQISVAAGQSLKIRNFTQEGGMSPGTVSVTTPTFTAGTTVLTAAIQNATVSPQLQVINELVIAGPATVKVTAGDETCFITYRKIPSN